MDLVPPRAYGTPLCCCLMRDLVQNEWQWQRSMTNGYVELHAASAFCFWNEHRSLNNWFNVAVELQMPAMALLDRNCVYARRDSRPALYKMTYVPI